MGVATLVAGLTSFPLQPPSLGHVLAAAVCAAAAIVLFRMTSKGTLPFRAWVGVPVLLGVAAWVLAAGSMSGFLSGIGAADVGVGTGLIAFAGLQAWADRRGRPEWTALAVLAGLMVAGYLIGAVAFYAGE